MKLILRDITIRDIQIKDAGDYLSFAKEILLEEKYSVTDIDDFKITIAEEEKWIEKIISNPNNILLLAINNNEILGSISIIQNTEKKTSHVAELSVHVKKKYRNNKIGRLLIEHSLQKIKQIPSIQKIILYVLGSNEHAIHLYKNLEFNFEGTLKKQVKMQDGNYEDLIIMSLEM